jgi:hypothetical protein
MLSSALLKVPARLILSRRSIFTGLSTLRSELVAMLGKLTIFAGLLQSLKVQAVISVTEVILARAPRALEGEVRG